MKYSLYIITLIIGVTTGWVIHGKQIISSAERSEQKPSKEQRVNSNITQQEAGYRKFKTRQKPVTTGLQAIIAKLGSNYNPTKINAILAKTDPEAIPGLLKLYEARSGLKGLTYPDNKIYLRVLGYWHKQNPEQAINYCNNLPHRDSQVFLLKKLISATANSDFSSAYDQAKIHLLDDKGNIDYPENFLHLAMKSSPEDLVKVLIDSSRMSDEVNSERMTYLEGFPYEQVINKLSEHQATLNEGEKMTLGLTNLLSNWAALEPESAYQWVMDGNKLHNNDSINALMEGYGKVASTEDIGKLSAEYFESNKESIDVLANALTIRPDANVYQSFKSNLNGNVNQHDYNVQLMQKLINHPRQDLAARLAVLSQIPKDEQLTIFEDPGFYEYDQNVIRNTLLAAGHNEEDINQHLPASQ